MATAKYLELPRELQDRIHEYYDTMARKCSDFCVRLLLRDHCWACCVD